MRLRIAVIMLLCVALSGCVSARKTHKLKKQIAELESVVAISKGEVQRRDMELAQLRKALEEKDAALQDRNKKLEEMKKKLEGFGVF